MPVYARENESIVSYIQHLLIDPNNGKIAAFVTNLIKGEIILPQDVLEFRQQRLEIQSLRDLVNVIEISRINQIKNENRYLLTKKVKTASGEFVGRVYDYEVDIQKFVITKLYTQNPILGLIGRRKRIIDAANIIEIKKEYILVRDSNLQQLSFQPGT